MAVTLLDGKSLKREISGLLVTLTPEGIVVKSKRRHECSALKASWRALCKFLLEHNKISLTSDEWEHPCATMSKFGKKRERKKREPAG